ncbi:MAG: repair protein SbcD/Mre11 [Solirubrobacteraceae bacterium]|jgi:DNA repair exonuclease SbcCD nuclease subunit|nr:repair protein SbcD/Mre11 [Solirubrobacteraceae bacterium]
MKFVHAADPHIDSPMKGLAAYPGAPVEAMRGATRNAFDSLVELCIAEHADLLLVAGDVYDGDWKDFSTGLYLRAQLGRLRDAGIEVAMIHGNHDAASVITRQLRLPGIHVLRHGRPESVVFEDLGVVVHGQSFANRAVTENLADSYPDPLPGLVNIGLLHTCLGGDAGHENYAPCSLEQLVGHGYDYWALGHIHERAVLHANPYVVFAGNLQGRHMRECGAKGATVVEVIDGAMTLQHHVLDHVRWARVTVDAAGVADDIELLERGEAALRSAVEAADGRLVACRIEVEGITRVHERLVRDQDRLESELRALATDLHAEQVWVERICWQTSVPRAAAIGDDAVGETLKILRHAGADAQRLAVLADRLAPLALKLPAELKHGPDGFDPTNPETLARLLADVERTLPSLLIDREAA